jgi:hypothetical protein
MGLWTKAKKAAGKVLNPILKPFQKASDKLIPNELRKFLPYASMFLPASGIMGQLGGMGGFGKMYAANMLTQAMGDPEADFEDLNQLSGILSGGQGYLSGANSASNLRGMKSPEAQGYQQALDFNEASGQMIKPTALTGLENRSFLTKAGDLGLEGLANASEYLTGNTDTLQDVGSGRVDLFNIENAKNAAKAIAPEFAKATGDVAVNYQRPAMRDFEKQEAADAAEIEETTTANDSERAYYSMKFNREAGNSEEVVEETLNLNGLGDYYEPPQTAAHGGLMGRPEYEFGGITEALKNAGARGLMTQNKAMGGMMSNDKTYHQYHDQTRPMDMEQMMGYNMGGSVLPKGMEMDYRGGGFIPIGSKERADDVDARVSKNEFVMTADAVRAAGGGSVNEGARRMYNLMNNLEAKA